MAINISQAFHRTSAAAIDDTLTLTKAEMLTVNDNLMPAKYLTVCQDDGKIYLYDKSATPSQETGKFSVFEGGGSGVSSYNDLTDKPSLNGNMLSGNKTNSQLGIPTALSEMTDDATHRTVTDTQMTTWSGKQNAITAGANLAFDGNTLNASMPVLGTINRSDIYDTTEKVIGKWTDGRPIYQKTLIGNVPLTSAVGTPVQTDISIGASVKDIISIDGVIFNGTSSYQTISSTDNSATNTIRRLRTYANNTTSGNPNVVAVVNDWFTSGTPIARITVRYTKTTDAANSYNYADENDYSTTEHIVGKWIDGKPVYQKTISVGALPNTTLKNTAHNISDLKEVVNIMGYCYNSTSKYSAPLPYTDVSNIASNICVYITTTSVIVSTGTDRSNWVGYVTIQYTKTTD